ncbi:MAG: BamA/TamA family outer membrane protein, partial [Candidatus Electryoneaceae bacterium]|nr:BamA/TamA family outer membrane protein [Candidatus Electryoneaceae bacterium]
MSAQTDFSEWVDTTLVMSHSDSIRIWKQQVQHRTTTEKIARVPGQVIYFPMKWTFKGMKVAIAYVDNTKIIDRVDDWLHSDDGLRAVIPTYAARTGAGVKYWHRDLLIPGSKLTATATAGLCGHTMLDVFLDRLDIMQGVHQGNGRFQYQFLPDEPFFGIGPDSDEDNESNYALEQTLFEVGIGRRLNPNISINSLLGWENNHTFSADEDDPPSTPDTFSGMRRRVELFRGRIGLTYDSRNRLGNPSSGTEASLAYEFNRQLNAEDYKFWKISTDVTHYVHLFYDRTIVLKTAVEITEPFSGSGIPFYHL